MMYVLQILFLMLIYSNIQPLVFGEPQVPCYFIFGDSLVDNGNNNGLETVAKVNYAPYGIDFPAGPTGRFSNGRNVADFLAERLGFDSPIPPHATAMQGQLLLNGVNYASGGAGILNETGTQLGGRICLDEQLMNHKIRISEIGEILGSEESAMEHLNKCVYQVWMGSNDYINNYYMPTYYQTSRMYKTDQFADLLIQHYSQQLTQLYNYGARKVAVFGLGPVGSTPIEVSEHKDESSFVNQINMAVVLFNMKLTGLVDQLSKTLPGATFTYINSLNILARGTLLEGFEELLSPCCEIPYSGVAKGQCLNNGNVCNERGKYSFFDGFHPSEAGAKVVADTAYNAPSMLEAYPFDISNLVQYN